MTLSWLEKYSAARVAALVIVPSLTSYTLIDLARQVQRSKGVSKALWLAGGSLSVALGVSCTMELSAGPVAGAYPTVLADFLPQAACAFAGCVWTLITLSRRQVRAAWLLISSILLSFGLTAMDDRVALLRMRQDMEAADVFAISLVVTIAASYLFLKIGALAREEKASWSTRILAAAVGMGLLLAGNLIFVVLVANAVSFTTTRAYLLSGLPLTIMCSGTVAVLCLVLAAIWISRQNLLRSAQLQQTLDDQRMRDALSDQRVTRLQNEALLQEIQERRSAEEKLRYAAFHDAATGLENRYSVAATLTERIETATPKNPPRCAVILFHLEDLNTVNSLVGRRTADQVLVAVAKRLQRFVTADHVLARVGDDRFLLLTQQMPSQDQVLRKANLMLSSLEDPVALDGTVVNLSASVGVCVVGAGHLRADDVLRDADMAAEVAKRNGGRQCRIFNSAMRDEALELQQRKRELTAALQQEEFVLFYQPLVDMRDRTIYGMEALVRWNHPTRGLVPPGAFIALSEETGQILHIGEWTLRTACREFATLQAESKRDLLLSVNVSPRQLFETPFLKLLQAVLEETSMPPAQLQLEVTESIFLKDASAVGSLMRDIRALGVKIAFDDFGTGYSSLSYLTRYPIDTLKVDQSFVRGMTQDEGGANLVMFMMGLATQFNMSVTAEGVEELQHEAALLKQGCCYAQGYLYSRPVPIDAMMQLLHVGLKLDQSAGNLSRFPSAAGPLLVVSTTSFRTSATG